MSRQTLRPANHARRAQRGMTLVELMVALAIGVGVTVAITTLLIAGENHKRTTTSTNDAEQSGAYAFHSLDGVLRGAGSGFAESNYPTDVGVLGCRLNVNGFLPTGGAFPAPFNGALLTAAAPNLRVAPLFIAKAQSPDGVSDVLVVMGGSGAAGGVSRQITGSAGPTSLVLDNTVGFLAQDLALVSQSGTPDCLLEEALSTPPVGTSTLTVGGAAAYYTTGTTTTLTTLASSTSTYVTPLGNAGANNVQFEMLGVDANHTLYTYDLLRNLSVVQAPGTPNAAQPIVDGVYRMNAIYGIDTTGNGVLGAWAGPGAPQDPTYDFNTVMTTLTTMKKIIAVRVALVVRGEYYDKNTVSPATLTIFTGLQNAGGTSLQQTVTLNANDQHYRYRVFEFTVPLRNMILLAGA